MADPVTNVTNPPEEPYHGKEFDEFLKEIGNANLRNWSIVAEAMGVSRMTILRWRKHPLAREAINSAIEEHIRKMSEVGGTDWKMHREMLKMLGVRDTISLEHEVNPDTLTQLLDKMETDYDNVGREARKQVVAAKQPIQDQG
jgi:hypothetical protein